MRVRMQPTVWIRGARGLARGQRPSKVETEGSGEDGFSLIEAIVGVTIVFGAMMMIVTGISTGVRGVLIGRQRQTATTVAKQTVEDIRRACYERIGHQFGDPVPANNDATLTIDPDLTVTGSGSSQVFTYTPTAEKLARAGSSSNCSGPAVVPAHTWAGVSDDTAYTVAVYVTHVEPTTSGGGVRHKRVTVDVEWDGNSGGTPGVIRLSSLVFDPSQVGGTSGGGGTAAFPVITASAQPVAGSITYSGSMEPATGGPGVTVPGTTLNYPASYAYLRSFLVDDLTGNATTHSFSVTDASMVAPPGCTQSAATLTCPAASSSSTADSDGGTSPTPPFYDAQSVAADAQSVGSTTGLYSINTGAGTGDSKSTACDTASCNAPIGDADGYPFNLQVGAGPSSFGSAFDIGGGVAGDLVSVGGGTTARGEVDRDYVGGLPRTTASAKNTYASVDVFRLQNTTLPQFGFGTSLTVLSVGGINVTTAADIGDSGTGALGATCSSSGNVSINVLGTPGIQNVTFDPCTTTKDETYARAFAIVDQAGLPAAVVKTGVRIVANPWTETETTDGAGFKHAEAKLLNWLTITASLDITVGSTVVTDIEVVLDYGDLTAVADRTP